MKTTIFKQVKIVKANGKHETFRKSKISRLVSLIEKQYQKFTGSTSFIPFALHTPDGTVQSFGGNEPDFTIILNNEQAVFRP